MPASGSIPHVPASAADLEPVALASLTVGARLVAAHWPTLYLRGAAVALEPPLVAIVGTREADPHGLALAHALAAATVGAGAGVLSGGALGIDAAAHAGALTAGGRTVVVLPSGFEHLYPLRHGVLYERIVSAGGALVSPFPPATPPARWTFPRRNELLAALCDLLVVVQAPVASGSLLTAEAARRLGRRVLVVPASPGDPRGGGCIRLLRLGAELCSGADDLRAAIAHRDGPLPAFAASRAPVRERAALTPATHASASRTRTRARAKAPDAPAEPVASASWSLDGDGRVVYHSLASEPRHVDELAIASALSSARVRVALLTLVLLGLARDAGDGRYARAG